MAAVMQPVKHGAISWEEYLSLPLTRYEIIDGKVIELPTPTLKHQDIVGRLLGTLNHYIKGKSLGKVFPAPYDFVIQPKVLPELHLTPRAIFEDGMMEIKKTRAGLAERQFRR